MHRHVLEASGRVAFDVHGIMSALRFEETRRGTGLGEKRGKKEGLSTVEAVVASSP